MRGGADLSERAKFLLHLTFGSGYTWSFPPMEAHGMFGCALDWIQRVRSRSEAGKAKQAREVKFGPNCKLCNVKGMCG
jgi:hypothetical protein